MGLLGPEFPVKIESEDPEHVTPGQLPHKGGDRPHVTVRPWQGCHRAFVGDGDISSISSIEAARNKDFVVCFHTTYVVEITMLKQSLQGV